MTTHAIRAIHLPQHSVHTGMMPWHVVVLGTFVILAFAVIWFVTVGDALHPYGQRQ
ncbi:MAG: hypothetical protein ACRETQ_09020 [Gammaproteobacteria bacterium]